jgi:hypothetical protein
MGEAQTAAVDGPYSAFWNPAGLGGLRYPEAAFAYARLAEGVDPQHAAYAHPVGVRKGLAASFTRLAIGPFDSYDANGARRGSVDSEDLAISAAYGQRIFLTDASLPEISAGFVGSYISERLHRTQSQTVSCGAGLLVSGLERTGADWAEGLRLGLAARNIGPGMKFDAERAGLPATVSLGLAWERKPWGDPATLALDYQARLDDSHYVGAGLEYVIRRVLAVRAGTLVGKNDGPDLRLGVGFSMKRLMVEYAWTGLNTVGDFHQMGLRYRFGGTVDVREKTSDDFIDQGKRYLRQNRIYEAAVEFNHALETDPGNRQALELLKQATEERPVRPAASATQAPAQTPSVPGGQP